MQKSFEFSYRLLYIIPKLGGKPIRKNLRIIKLLRGAALAQEIFVYLVFLQISKTLVPQSLNFKDNCHTISKLIKCNYLFVFYEMAVVEDILEHFTCIYFCEEKMGLASSNKRSQKPCMLVKQVYFYKVRCKKCCTPLQVELSIQLIGPLPGLCHTPSPNHCHVNYFEKHTLSSQIILCLSYHLFFALIYFSYLGIGYFVEYELHLGILWNTNYI